MYLLFKLANSVLIAIELEFSQFQNQFNLYLLQIIIGWSSKIEKLNIE